MKVAIIMPLAERKGGAELLLLHLLKGSRGDASVQYGVAFLNEGPMVQEAGVWCPLVKTFRAGRIRHAHRLLVTIGRLACWLREQRFDVVMSWMSTGHLYGFPAARLAGIPNVWWQWGFPDRGLLERIIERTPTAQIFCCSAAVERLQSKLTPRFARAVILPGVDLEVYNPKLLPPALPQRVSLGLPEEGVLVGIIGRLQRWKGMDVLVDAAAEMARERSDVHFLIVGGVHALEPEYPAELARRIAERGLTERVTLTGFQSAPAAWMNACDVVVHASVTPEPFGIVILEAMALGKVVIASGAGGPLEFVVHGENGFLSPPGDAVELARTIRQALEVGVHNHQLRENARLTAGRFSIERFAGEVGQHLRRVVHGMGAGRDEREQFNAKTIL